MSNFTTTSLGNPGRFALAGSRWIPLLLLLLVAQLAVTLLIYWPRSAAVGAGEALLAAFDPAQVQGLTITDGNEKTIHAVRQDGGWVLPDAGDYPVKDEKVTGLLEKLAGLTRDRLVATQSATLTQLKVADDSFARRIQLEMADASQQTLFVGDGPRFRTSHVRLGEESNAYLSLNFSADESATRMTDWIDTSYLRIPEASVQKMGLENGNGVFNFFRDEQDQWQIGDLAEDEVFNANNLTSMLTTLSSLNMAEPLGKEAQPAYGLESPTARVQLEYKDDAGDLKTAELLIGALDPSNSYYAVHSTESPYYVYIAKYSLDRFVERTRADFLQQPPTPTPAP